MNKIGRILLCIVMIINVFSFAFTASADSDSDINVIFNASDNSVNIQTFSNPTGSWEADPTNNENTAFALNPIAGTLSSSKYLRIDLTDDIYKTYSGYCENKSFTLDYNKPVVYEAKIYFSQDQLDTFKSFSGSYFNYLMFAPAEKTDATSSTAGLGNYSYGFYKRSGEDNVKFGYRNSADGVTVTAGWHSCRYVRDFKNSKLSVWFDDTQIALNADYKPTTVLSFDSMKFCGLEFFDKANNNDYRMNVLENGIMFDDIKIYQANNSFDAAFTFDSAAKKGIINFTSAVKDLADIDSKIVFKDSSNNILPRTITLSADKKSAEVIFATELENGINYTVTFAGNLTDAYGQTMADEKAVNFSIGEAARIDSRNEFWNLPAGDKYNNLTKVDDPAEEHTAQVSKVSSTISIRKMYGDLLSNYSTYNESRQLIESVEFYLPSTGISKNASYEFKFNGGDGSQAAKAYGLGRTKIAVSDGKFIATELQADGSLCSTTKEIAADSWHTITYVYQPAANFVRTYFDGELFSTTVEPYNKTRRISSVETTSSGGLLNHIDGIRITATDEMYIANLKLYQMVNPVGIESAEYDSENDVWNLTLKTTTTQSALANGLKLMNGTNEISGAIKSIVLADNAYMAQVTIDYEFDSAGDYKLIIPANYTDMNLQYATVDTGIDLEFSVPTQITADFSVTTEPSENGAAVNVLLTNSGNAADVFAVIAAYGDNNLLLGIDKHEFCLSASENLTFTISEDLSKAQTIRLFVWDGENTMIPYIASIPCWTK